MNASCQQNSILIRTRLSDIYVLPGLTNSLLNVSQTLKRTMCNVTDDRLIEGTTKGISR